MTTTARREGVRSPHAYLSRLESVNRTGLSARATGVSVGRALIMLAALAGLFSMHGLSNHGMTGHGSMDQVAASSLPTAMDAHTSPRSVMDDVSQLSPGQFVSPDMSGAMTDACLAVLLAVGLWWAQRSRSHIQTWLSGSWQLATTIRARARAPDPPSLIRLSIQRC